MIQCRRNSATYNRKDNCWFYKRNQRLLKLCALQTFDNSQSEVSLIGFKGRLYFVNGVNMRFKERVYFVTGERMIFKGRVYFVTGINMRLKERVYFVTGERFKECVYTYFVTIHKVKNRILLNEIFIFDKS